MNNERTTDRSSERRSDTRNRFRQQGHDQQTWVQDVRKIESDLRDSAAEVQDLISDIEVAGQPEAERLGFAAVNSMKTALLALKDAQIELLTSVQAQLQERRAA